MVELAYFESKMNPLRSSMNHTMMSSSLRVQFCKRVGRSHKKSEAEVYLIFPFEASFV